jgi:3-dehydroquinate synthase
MQISVSASAPYTVSVGRGLLKDLCRIAAGAHGPCRAAVVTDENVAPLYLDAAVRSLETAGFSAVTLTLPAGERYKTLDTFGRILGFFAASGLQRRDLAVALGGGVVGDVTGFAAGCYLRGIAFLQVPTTLLAMVDAAVGGKTAVNLGGVKNAVGLFRQPKAVMMDPDTLATLPPRQLANGLAEAVKMALTHDAALFARFEDPAGYGPIEEIIAACLRIKAAVVAADEREAGLRRVLNFGHTLGHGIEAAAEGSLLHGECVGLGMLPMCAPPLRERLRAVLERLDLPTYVSFNELDPDAVLAAVAHDKKALSAGSFDAVFVSEPGRFELQRISLNELKARLNGLSCPLNS